MQKEIGYEEFRRACILLVFTSVTHELLSYAKRTTTIITNKKKTERFTFVIGSTKIPKRIFAVVVF